MSRWRVMKNHFADAWSVYREPPKDAGMVPWHRVPQWFDTWAEAMAYADQRARTIQVTLPRKLSLPGVYLEWDKIGFRKIHAEDCPIDIEYLGTALLALHHRKRVTIHQ